jgi:hypothetical protein
MAWHGRQLPCCKRHVIFRCLHDGHPRRWLIGSQPVPVFYMGFGLELITLIAVLWVRTTAARQPLTGSLVTTAWNAAVNKNPRRVEEVWSLHLGCWTGAKSSARSEILNKCVAEKKLHTEFRYENLKQGNLGLDFSIMLKWTLKIHTPWFQSAKRTIPTERPPLVGEVSAHFSG